MFWTPDFISDIHTVKDDHVQNIRKNNELTFLGFLECSFSRENKSQELLL